LDIANSFQHKDAYGRSVVKNLFTTLTEEAS
jgi:hypothetical protein